MADNNVLPSSSESTEKLPLRSSLMPYITAAVFATAWWNASAGPEPILGVQSPATQCYNTTNLQVAESISKKYPRTEKLVYTVNGETMGLIAFRWADTKIDIVIAEKRNRTWFAGRCFDVWDGQVYPTYPSPDGQWITKKNIFGHVQKWVMDEKKMPIGWWYVWVEAVVRYVDEKAWWDTRIINDTWSSVSWNLKRITRLMLEDPDLNNTDSQDAFIASLLQIQLDLESNPSYYNKDIASKKLGKSNIDFIMKHVHPSFISPRDIPKYTELVNRALALLSK